MTSRSTRRRPGQARREAEDPPDVGQPPAVDRLVVVADQEDPVGRRGEQQGEPELRPVDVLDLVDEELAAARAPARQQRRVAPRARAIARRIEVVEVEPAASRRRPPRRRRTPARIGPASGSAATSAAVDPELDLQPRDDRVEPQRARPRRPTARPRAGSPARSASGSTATPASRRISRPRAWNVRTRTAPGATPSGATAASSRSVISTRRPLVEGDRPDRLGRRPGGDEPGGPGDERRRLAAARRRDAQRRPGRRGRGGPLVGREPRQAFGDRRMEVHRGRMARAARPAVIGRRRPPRDVAPSPRTASATPRRPIAVAPASCANAIHGPLMGCYRRRQRVPSRGWRVTSASRRSPRPAGPRVARRRRVQEEGGGMLPHSSVPSTRPFRRVHRHPRGDDARRGARRRPRRSPSAANPAHHSDVCQLRSDKATIKHVIYIQFDNMHFLRDNPNVPSDLEQMPNLLNFIKDNGTLLTQRPHGPDLAHGRRDPEHAHRPLSRPARAGRLELVRLLQARRLGRLLVHVQVLDGQHRRRQPGEQPADAVRRPELQHGQRRLRRARRHRRRPQRARAVGAVHARRLRRRQRRRREHRAREQQRDHPALAGPTTLAAAAAAGATNIKVDQRRPGLAAGQTIVHRERQRRTPSWRRS